MSKEYECVWCDGCYDVPHFGHFNCLRQCAEISKHVVAGVHSNEIIESNKSCPPVFNLEERAMMIEACKWVDKVHRDAPWKIDLDIIDNYGCQVAVHGDDIVIGSDGTDCYAHIRETGRLRIVPRTKAISTTNIIGRMLRLPASELPEGFDINKFKQIAGTQQSLHTYIPTTHRIAQFSEPVTEPKPNDKIVYVDGTFDLLHPGHVSFLKKARAMGDYLVVGIHDDQTMESISGNGFPIETLQERVLNVLALKYVDDVIIGAPYVISKELMDQIRPDIVVQGSVPSRTRQDAFAVPKELGIFQQITSDYPEMTARTIVHRVLDNYAVYADRNSKKESTQCEVANKVQ